MAVNLRLRSKNITIITIYCPEPSNKNRYCMSEFFDDFTTTLTIKMMK
jgi:hypothetical protein